jgi:hypothetical protein
MGTISSYEQKALSEVEREKQRTLAKSPRRLVPARVKATATNAGRRAKELPGAEKAAQAAARGYAKAAEGMGKLMARSSQFTLSGHRVLRAYRRHGHTLENLADIRGLDLQVVDRVARFRRLNHIYASAAAAEGAGSGAAISGGTLLAAGGSAGAGAGAAPGLALVTTAVATDAAAVLMAASRVVAHTALYYGYNPEDPKEEIFLMSVISLGAASTQGAKMSAYSELSRLTQMLARSAPWAKLNTSVLARVSQKFAAKFGQNLTKKKLGQFVPLAGIAVGAGMNYAMVDNIADAAYWSYRERFLRDKLGEEMAVPSQQALGPADAEGVFEEPIDVLKLLEGEGINTSGGGESGV